MRCAFLSSVRHQEDRPVALDPYPVFRRGHTLFHSECHLGDYVQEFGDEQCRCGSRHRPPLPSLGNQTALVAFCGHHPDKTLVDSPAQTVAALSFALVALTIPGEISSSGAFIPALVIC